MSWEVDKGPGAALSRGCKRSDFVALLGEKRKQLVDNKLLLTRSFLALYGALLSVMEVCVRLNFPDRSCQRPERHRQ